MSEQMRNRINGCSIWVILYGFFVGFSLIMQCIIPALALLSTRLQWSPVITEILNNKFVLPLDVIVWIWTVMAAGYIGVDRTVFFAITVKGNFGEIKVGNPNHLHHIIIESGILYGLAVVLNLLFDIDLQLTPLCAAFGSSVLFYVLGHKSITGASALAPHEDLNKNGIDDLLEEASIFSEEEKKIIKARQAQLAQTAIT
jgi:hypothetical protein